MATDTQSLVEEWEATPDRPVVLFDETREDGETDEGQFVVFSAVVIDGARAIGHLRRMDQVRQSFPNAQSREKSFKARELFGNRAKRSHRELRSELSNGILGADALYRVVTTDRHIRESAGRTVNGIYSLDSSGKKTLIDGRELLPILAMFRRIAFDRNLSSAAQIDVVIDRSSKTGLDPAQRRLKQDEYELIGPGKIATPGPDPYAANFLLVPDSDDGQLRDLLLLPESLGYLSVRWKKLDEAKQNVLDGEPFVLVRSDGRPKWVEDGT